MHGRASNHFRDGQDRASSHGMMAFVIPVVEHWLEHGLFNEVPNPFLGSEM